MMLVLLSCPLSCSTWPKALRSQFGWQEATALRHAGDVVLFVCLPASHVVMVVSRPGGCRTNGLACWSAIA